VGLISFLGLVSEAWAAPGSAQPARWWKGNLHTHSFWSDGDDFPEMIAEWYKTNGYHFVAFSDHNTLQEGSKWMSVNSDRKEFALAKYLERFGPRWVDRRFLEGTQQVRLKTLAEYRSLFEKRDLFLLVPGEEITDRFRTLPIHVNANNVRHLIRAQGGSNVVEVMQRNVNAVLAQRRRTGRPMFPHINHPNFGYAITAEDLMMVSGERFFEVYNGHPMVHNFGDEHHVGTDRIWDILLAFRLSRLKLGPMYGLAVDDSHHYHVFANTNSNAGRGWVMVRSRSLTAGDLITAMETGDFYASTGVRVKELQRSTNQIALQIDPEPGVNYVTQFIGTLKGFNPASEPGPRPTDSLFPVTRRYSADIGRVLAQVEGPIAIYNLLGDEIYVRARIVSSKIKVNAAVPGEPEMAWIQPVVVAGE
jgi:predicted metal-dependent phosphoesterase TrpH